MYVILFSVNFCLFLTNSPPCFFCFVLIFDYNDIVLYNNSFYFQINYNRLIGLYYNCAYYFAPFFLFYIIQTRILK